MCNTYLFLNILVWILRSSALIFHPLNAIKYSGPEYFGYSVFLQRSGNRTHSFRTVVGSPKTDNLFTCIGKVCNVSKIQLKTGHIELLGAAIDGGNQVDQPLLVCSPRYTTIQYRTNGRCVILKGDAFVAELTPLSGDRSQIRNYNGTYEYLYSHGEAGFSTRYVHEKNEWLIGAPGYLSWKGSVIKYAYSGFTRLNPERKTDKDSYLGYSITYGRFPYGHDVSMFIVAGAPRGSELKGSVFVLDYNNFNTHVITILESDQMGSYFGSSVLVVSKNDIHVSMLFVGAPTYSTKTYDEGCVFGYYSNGVHFVLSEKICGKYKGGRFGTAMVSLGHLNRDLYEDMAIAAPYEEDGRGAVYIYLGGSNGFKEIEKITAKSIDDKLKGFGFSLSNAIDIDYNGNNDFAVGAYKSNTVVILKSRLVVDCSWYITTSVDRIQDSTQQFDVEICLSHNTLLNNSEPLTTHLIISGDERVLLSSKIQVLNMQIGATKCAKIIVKPKHQTFDSPAPLILKVTSNLPKCVTCPVSIPTECSHIHKIPFVTGCGDDNICMPKLKIDAHFNTKEYFIIGSNDSLSFTVNIRNDGESGYLCKLETEMLVDVTQIPSLCTKHEFGLICDVANRLKTNEMRKITFEIYTKTLSTSPVQVSINVSCSGEGEGKFARTEISLPLMLKSKITLTSFSNPEHIMYSEERSLISFTHEYTLHNVGPSPLVGHRALFEIPEQFMNENSDIIASFDIKPNVPKCMELKKREIGRLNLNMLEDKSLYRKFSLSCDNKLVTCLKYTCVFDELPANRILKFKFTMVGNIEKLIEFCEKESKTKDLLVIESTSSIRNISSDLSIIKGTYTTLQRQVENEKISLSVWIMSITAAVLILSIIIFVLYKVNFFARPIREKLRNEDEEMESRECIIDSSLEDEVAS